MINEILVFVIIGMMAAILVVASPMQSVVAPPSSFMTSLDSKPCPLVSANDTNLFKANLLQFAASSIDSDDVEPPDDEDPFAPPDDEDPFAPPDDDLPYVGGNDCDEKADIAENNCLLDYNYPEIPKEKAKEICDKERERVKDDCCSSGKDVSGCD